MTKNQNIMKKVAEDFKDYYPISQEEKMRVFKDKKTYFVFDTNALLDIYRVGKSLSSKIMKILENYKDQIVIPFHVAEEYHDNMLSVIIGYSNKYDYLAKNLSLEVLSKGVISEYELDKFPFIRDTLKRCLGDVPKQFAKEMQKEYKFLHSQLSTWNLQNNIASFLDNKILQGFSKEKIAEIEKDGAERYKLHIPPGHEDKDKTTNKYGDLIIWKELLEFANGHQDSSIVLVSRDLKEDWITKIHGKKWGPRVELLKEFHEKNPNTLLMYTLVDFIRYANTDTNILDDKEMQSVEDYTSSAETTSKTTDQINAGNVNFSKVLSDKDLQNLLLLSLLRRSINSKETDDDIDVKKQTAGFEHQNEEKSE